MAGCGTLLPTRSMTARLRATNPLTSACSPGVVGSVIWLIETLPAARVGTNYGTPDAVATGCARGGGLPAGGGSG